jgi:hypothetical protein
MQKNAAEELANALTTIVLLGVVGYFCGAYQGQGNELLLAACGAALGTFVVILGYGPVALIISAFSSLARWFRGRS